MGAWDTGSFDNDTARDWVGDLCEGKGNISIRQTLSQALESRTPPQPSFIGRWLLRQRPIEPYLSARNACQALAAAEIVAYWRGQPIHDFPDTLDQWAREHANLFMPDLSSLARQAVISIKAKSELKELFSDNDGTVDPDWLQAVDDLEQRLKD